MFVIAPNITNIMKRSLRIKNVYQLFDTSLGFWKGRFYRSLETARKHVKTCLIIGKFNEFAEFRQFIRFVR